MAKLIYESLVEHIYDAALEPAKWPPFLAALSEAFHCAKVYYFNQEYRTGRVLFLTTDNVDDIFVRDYHQHFALLNPWTKEAGRLDSGTVHTTDELVPGREILHSEFYNGWLRPQKVDRGFGMVVFRDHTRLIGLSVLHREQPDRGWDLDHNLRLMRRLVPHMQRAAQIERQLARARATETVMSDLIARLPIAAFIFDDSGRIIHANAKADALVALGDGLQLRHGVLAGKNAVDSAALQRLMREAAATGHGQTTHCGGIVSLSRDDGRHPLFELVAPLGSAAPGHAGACLGLMAMDRPAGIVFVSDPETQQAVPRGIFKALYGLSPAESDLALHIVKGGTVLEWADLRMVSIATARAQMRQLLEKTRTNRQGELMRLLLAGPLDLARLLPNCGLP